MKRKRIHLISLCFIILLAFSACDNNSSAGLSMDKLQDLAQNGEDLSWNNFEDYPFEDMGSGLYIRKYEMEGDYYVLMGGGSLSMKPSYIQLVKSDGEKIDIRYDDINQFIKK